MKASEPVNIKPISWHKKYHQALNPYDRDDYNAFEVNNDENIMYDNEVNDLIVSIDRKEGGIKSGENIDEIHKNKYFPHKTLEFIKNLNLLLLIISFILRLIDYTTTYMLLEYPCYQETNPIVRDVMDYIKEIYFETIIVFLYLMIVFIPPILYFSSKITRNNKILGIVILFFLISIIAEYIPVVYKHCSELFGIWTGRIVCL